MNNEVLSQKEIIKKECNLYNESFEEIEEANIPLQKRKQKFIIEYDFNMPQTIFYIYDKLGNIVVGRKLLSDYYIKGKLKSLNCSRITYNMILGSYSSHNYNKRKITISYQPFSLKEKKKYLEKIIKNLNDYYIEYPFHYKFFETNLEQDSKSMNWRINQSIATYLNLGESHIRSYAKKNLLMRSINPKVIYDPACSTGKFLETLKKIFPNAKTIGHDLSQVMVRYSQKFVDESYCCDAINSPIEDNSVDLLLLRFLNGGVVSAKDAYKLFDFLLKKVKKGGYILCIGHTPILISHNHLKELNLDIIDSIGYEEKTKSIFQYYLIRKK